MCVSVFRAALRQGVATETESKMSLGRRGRGEGAIPYAPLSESMRPVNNRDRTQQKQEKQKQKRAK